MPGAFEKHCETQLKSVGWIPILPEMWQSVFYHPELELMLVVCVDDFKMAGPAKNMAQGWKDINSVIDMDPPEALGRYFGCNHVEQQQVSCPKSEHPFARVFEGKPAAIARGNPSPVRREDFWEVDLEAGAVVRHHVYPRKKLYVPMEDDVLAFPMMGTSRVTEFDSKEELHVDDFNQGGEAKFDCGPAEPISHLIVKPQWKTLLMLLHPTRRRIHVARQKLRTKSKKVGSSHPNPSLTNQPLVWSTKSTL